MREWNIPPDGPLSLRIAADARVSIPSYVDDQIWELDLEGGDPPALSIHTTYGLRALSMRIFPGFGWGEASVVHPAHFATPPIIRSFLPNYLRLTFFAFEDLEVQAEYWTPDSQALAGRFMLRNRGLEGQEARLRLHAILQPGESSQVMDEEILHGVTVLAGRSGRLAPVVFLSGGAVMEQATFPALAVAQRLAPGEENGWIWVHAGGADHGRSFEAARELATKSWDAEIARLEMLGAGIVDIETGEEELDITLALAQKDALSGFVGPTRHLPHPSFVLTRVPDRGFSAQGDGSDYTLQWEGQGVADAYVNLAQILPVAPDLAKGVLRNFVATQSADGSMDWKPGMGGQRSGMLAVPLIASLTWKTYLHTEDRGFLRDMFRPLIDFFEAWFEGQHDRDEDGHPEWETTTQSGFDDNPSFVRWHRWAQGLDIAFAETPDLAAYLYRESLALIAIAELLGQSRFIPSLEARREKLRQAVEATWSEETASYHHVDRDFHCSTVGEQLGKGKGHFTQEVGRTFDPPVRVMVRSTGQEGLSHAVKIFIHGRGRRGRSRVEKLTERQFQWFWDFGTATSGKHYAEIERIEVSGLSDEFETEIQVADFSRQDQTLLVPLWAGIPTTERAKRIVRETILDKTRYWRPFGIPACSAQDPAYAADGREGAGGVWMFWNLMLGEGLVNYGYLEEAAELVGRLIAASAHTLRTEKAFRQAYNADQAEGLGDRHHLCGIFPVDLFLSTLGVRLISPRKVWVRPHNPFPWPITLRWRGTQLVCEKERTVITFPDGQRVEVDGEEAQIVEQRRREPVE